MRLTPDRAYHAWWLWQRVRVWSYWSLGPIGWRNRSRHFD